MIRTIFFAVVCVAASINAQEAATARGVEIRTDFEAPMLKEALGKAIDRARPMIEGELKAKLPDGAKLVLNVFRTADAYATAITAAGAPALAKNLAATADRTGESYLVVQPVMNAEYMERVGHLPEQLLALALHECVHQTAAKSKLFPESYLPDWYCEGRADWITDLVLAKLKGKRALWSTEDELQIFAARAQGRMIPIDKLIDGHWSTTDDRFLFYAQARALYGYLRETADAKTKQKFAEFESAIVRKGRPGAGKKVEPVIAEITSDFKKRIDKLPAIDRAYQEAVTSTEEWSLLLRSAEWEKLELLCSQAAEGRNGIALRSAPLKGKKYAIIAEFIVHAEGTQQADLILGYDTSNGNILKLGIGAGGYLSLMLLDNDQWKKLANVDGSPLTLGGDEWRKVEATIDNGKVTAVVGDMRLTGEFDPKKFAGRVRVGCGACASFVRWREFALVESETAPKR